MAELSSGSVGEALREPMGVEEVAPSLSEEGNRTAEAGTLIASVGELDKAESVKLGIVILKSHFLIFGPMLKRQ